MELKLKSKKDGNTPDIFRDSMLRYFGYANELGESFRPIFPRFVIPSYLIAGGYVLGDTIDKSIKENNRLKQKDHKSLYTLSQDKKKSIFQYAPVVDAAIDTLLWQSLASVIIPGITINRTVAVMSKLIRAQTKHPMIQRWAPTLTGLSMIPVIIHPIDHFVDFLLDNTSRPFSKHLLSLNDTDQEQKKEK